MSKVFVSVGMSVDGFIAGPNRGPKNPIGDGGPAIHKWLLNQESFRRNLGLGSGGETGDDNRIIEEMMKRTGAHIMGKRMFEEGEANWPEDAPFHTPVFVLTHEARDPWPRKGGTTFHFINDGTESALKQARDAAGKKDIRISGGAETIRQYLDAGHVHEIWLHLAPLLLGRGVRLFDGVDRKALSVDIAEAIPSPLVTHVRYDVTNK